ncbi:hypothetical protein [Actinokineospora pegani]|uniref:hypothetical protein n=1 Tax=Actinokineospora pegani TaxID=2654637 RepID=UPI0012E9DEE9|nr:hypothetical protein [Actinokineospora pegani]
MTDHRALLDPMRWPRWLARDAERRKLMDPEALATVDHAVREFPAAAFAIGMLPTPLPVEQVEKLPRGEVRDAPDGARIRFRAHLVPGETRGWLLGNGVVISMAQRTVQPQYVPVSRGDGVALRRDGILVRSAIAGWEPFPAPVEVELDSGTQGLAEYLERVLAARRPL